MLKETNPSRSPTQCYRTTRKTKRIGLLYGFERSFPIALRREINKMAMQAAESADTDMLSFVCEDVRVDVMEASTEPLMFDVILDRISHDIPCYQPLVKLACLRGTRIINDPFLRHADDKFLQAALCTSLQISHPKTFLLPSHSYDPCRTTPQSLSNLSFPLSFTHVFETLGFPFYVKPVASFGWDRVTKVRDEGEFLECYDGSGMGVLMAQENVEWKWYLRCLFVDGDVYPARWDPRRPHQERYGTCGVGKGGGCAGGSREAKLDGNGGGVGATWTKEASVPDTNGTGNSYSSAQGTVHDVPTPVIDACINATRKLCTAMGYIINSVEFAISFQPVTASTFPPSNLNKIPLFGDTHNLLGHFTPYVIDMLNSVPDFDRDLSLGEEIFAWVVEKVAGCLISRVVLDSATSSTENAAKMPSWRMEFEREVQEGGMGREDAAAKEGGNGAGSRWWNRSYQYDQDRQELIVVRDRGADHSGGSSTVPATPLKQCALGGYLNEADLKRAASVRAKEG
ncbi:hypothetical protein HDV00_000496 [Rhizophlyctis rosea]|nr:hypothetical protein HDV00_000496 [Rhizophlyctis rosea]